MSGTGTAGSQRVDGRSDHKAKTRQDLIDAALWLFATKGYEATSTDEIAEAAGVSPRTFFRYFESKDRVLFFGGESFTRLVVRVLLTQPIQLPDLDAIAASVRLTAPAVAPPRARLRLYFKAVEASPVLAGKDAHRDNEHNCAIAAALALRRSSKQPDDQQRLAASVASVVVQRAYRVWASSKRDLAEVLDESFLLVRSVVAPLPK